jgi:hypothetical protein
MGAQPTKPPLPEPDAPSTYVHPTIQLPIVPFRVRFCNEVIRVHVHELNILPDDVIHMIGSYLTSSTIIIFGGGTKSTGKKLDTTMMYNPYFDKEWHSFISMPQARPYNIAAVHNQTLTVVGYERAPYAPRIYQLKLSSLRHATLLSSISWSSPPLLPAEIGHQNHAILGSKLHCMQKESHTTFDLDNLDFDTTPLRASTLPINWNRQPIAMPPSLTSSDHDIGHLLLLFGSKDDSIYQRYDPQSDTWGPSYLPPRRKRDIPRSRSIAHYVAIPSRYTGDESFVLHVDGLYGARTRVNHDDDSAERMPYYIERWSTVTKIWSTTNWTLPDDQYISDYGLCYANERLWLIGGIAPDGPSSSCWSLDVHDPSSQWAPGPSLPQPRYEFAVTSWI